MEKQLLTRANELYVAIGALVRNSVDPFSDQSGTYDEYDKLIEDYEFINEPFTSADGHQGVKWPTGEVMIPAEYDKIVDGSVFCIPCNECYAIAERAGRQYLVNYEGTRVFEADEIKPDAGQSQTFFFREGNLWGICNLRGYVVYGAQFDEITCASNGFIFVKASGKEGFIDFWGNYFEPRYDAVEFDAEDNIVVTLDGKKGYLDEEGNFVTDIREAYYNINMGL